MSDIHTVINDFKSKKSNDTESTAPSESLENRSTFSEIPDVFFDEVLIKFKLLRSETLSLIYIYRKVWCRPNLHKLYGVSPLISHTELAKACGLDLEEIYQALRKLESHGLIEVFRTGQYFVRKFLTKELDQKNSQTYDDFES